MTTPARTQESLWISPTIDPAWAQKIVDEFHIHPVTAQILAARGFSSLEEIHRFLYAMLPDLHDPFLMPDMDKAVKRIHEALVKKESVFVYGDNDVDGMTGASLLVEFLRSRGAQVGFYVPNPNVLAQSALAEALERALASQCTLMLTVDCGITGAKEIEFVAQRNIDVIITDHHEPTAKLPHCVATLNPRLINSRYPNRDLTGVGVAFKLIHALTSYLGSVGMIDPKEIDLKRYLDLVAMGTVADMGSLTGENRILVRYGLMELRKTLRVGVAKLASVCDLNLSNVSASDIASKLAPRLNSLGRIADPQQGVELLICRNPEEAQALAEELDLFNVQRQKIEQQMSEQVVKYIEDHPEILREKAIAMASHRWHPGIIAIVAARIAKQHHRPTVMMAIEKGVGKGSMRTIPKFPLLPVLKQHKELLLNFGGHDFAAGLTIAENNIQEFMRRFIATANETLEDVDVTPKLNIDAKADFAELTFEFMDSLDLLEPFGNGNPQPVLCCNAKQAWPPKIVGKTHLKFYLAQGDRILEGIGFGMAHRRSELLHKDIPLRVAFCPQINTFQNKLSIQLLVRDFKVILD